jgi:hypothetical protein
MRTVCTELATLSFSASVTLRVIQTSQSKILRVMTDAPWYVSIDTLPHDLSISIISEGVMVAYFLTDRALGARGRFLAISSEIEIAATIS